MVEIFNTVCYCVCMSLIAGLLRPRLFSSKLSKAAESARNNNKKEPSIFESARSLLTLIDKAGLI
jgi:hypothetical protein